MNTKTARDLTRDYINAAKRLSGEMPFQDRVALLTERVRLKGQIRDVLEFGTPQERVDAINGIRELILENEHQPFLECAVFLTHMTLNKKLDKQEKRAITELISTLSSLSEEQLDSCNLREGIEAHRLDLTVSMCKTIFREDFYRDGETDLFRTIMLALSKIDANKALHIGIDSINTVQLECLRQLNAFENADSATDPRHILRAKYLDVFNFLIEQYGDSCSPSFRKAVEEDSAAFEREMDFIMRESETARSMNSPLKHFMQLNFLGKLLKELRSSVSVISVDMAAGIKDLLERNDELKQELQKRQ